MIRRALVLAALLALSLASIGSAQGFALAARAGTIGLGAEGAYGVGDWLTLRGGLGLASLEIDSSNLIEVDDDVTLTLTLPKTWCNVGADLNLGDRFRIGGGILFKNDEPTLVGSLSATGTVEIGGMEYSGTEVSSVTAILDSNDQAAYAIIGFGSPRGRGIGLFLDVGVAFLGDPEVTLSATGDEAIVGSNEFQSQLRAEEQRIRERAYWYLKTWPILNLGVRIGL
jgi:hypothetical protein